MLFQKCEFEDAAMVRWVMQLSQYNFDVEFVEGKKNCFADMLSREFLTNNSILALSCNFIRRNPEEVQIETPMGWVTYNLSAPLLDHDRSWFPLKEIRHRTGIPYLWNTRLQDEMNEEAIEALDYLAYNGNITYHLDRAENDNLIHSYQITLRGFSNYQDRKSVV